MSAYSSWVGLIKDAIYFLHTEAYVQGEDHLYVEPPCQFVLVKCEGITMHDGDATDASVRCQSGYLRIENTLLTTDAMMRRTDLRKRTSGRGKI